MTLADQIRNRVAQGETQVFIKLEDGREALFLASKWGPRKLATATDADIRRCLVY